MKTSDFYYDLPSELIAQTPLERRDASRLMLLDKETGEVQHYHFYDLLHFLRSGDCLGMPCTAGTKNEARAEGALWRRFFADGYHFGGIARRQPDRGVSL